MTTIADNPSLLTTGALVGGEERPASGQRQFEVRNPARGVLIGYAADLRQFPRAYTEVKNVLIGLN